MIYRCGNCGKDFEVTGSGHFLCPHCKSPVVIPGSSAPLDWERRKEIGLFKAYWSTVKKSLSDPTKFFDSVPGEGGLESPLIYGMISVCVGIVFTVLYQVLFQSLGLFAQMMMAHSRELMFGAGLYGAIALGMVLGSPILAFIDLFIYSGILHLFVMMVGANKKGFEATFRAYAYSQGMQLLRVVPILGSLAGLVWFYILYIHGLKKLQSCTTGKAAAAAFLPLVLCCGLMILLIFGFAILGGILATSMQHSH
jgi:hypothetical protein